MTTELYGGENNNNLRKICELKVIEDQNYLPYGVRVFGANLNSLNSYINNIPVKILEVRLQ